MQMVTSDNSIEIIAFYKFVPIDKPRRLQGHLKKFCLALGMRGSILISSEGINATVSGSSDMIIKFKKVMAEEGRFADLWYKISYADKDPFKRMSVKLKKEIVTMGINSIDPNRSTATYLNPGTLYEWLKEKKDLVVIDVRNSYEFALGHFKGAIDPQTKSFREFPKWVEDNKDELANKTIVTYCTGGIRCEKATAFMQEAGYKNVFQLHGGVLNYFHESPERAAETWDGECFVFDDRMAITTDSKPSAQTICPTCISAVSAIDQESPLFVTGKQCPKCAPILAEFHQQRQEKGRKIHQENIEKKNKVSETIRQLRPYFGLPGCQSENLILSETKDL